MAILLLVYYKHCFSVSVVWTLFIGNPLVGAGHFLLLVLQKILICICLHICLFIDLPLAGWAHFCAYDCSITSPFSVSQRFCSISNLFAFLWAFVCLLAILLLVVYKHSFSVSVRFCLFIGNPLVGAGHFLLLVLQWILICICLPLCLFIDLPLAGWAHFWAYDCSITSPFSVSQRFCSISNLFAFLWAFVCLLAILLLVVYKHSFSISVRFSLFIGNPLAGAAHSLLFAPQ